MTTLFRGKQQPVPAQPLSARELVDKYSGVGLQFKVKFVGSENVNRKRGDAEAAKYCIPTLKVASQQSRIHKPRCALGLTLKGISLYDESTKNITRVPLEKVTYVSHDPVDVCYIGVIVSDTESHTGFKLYCFKAERPVAITIVSSAKELFQLMFKLRQARKKLKEEKEKAEKDGSTKIKYTEVNNDPEHSNLPAENAPPPSYGSVSDPPTAQQPTAQLVTSEGGPPERPPPPRPYQAPPLPPRPEEEDSLFSLAPPPTSTTARTNPPPSATTAATTAPSDGLFSGFEDLDLNEPMVSIASQPLPSIPQPTGGNASANPFTGGGGFMQQPPQMQDNIYSEPSITMDLMDAIKNPAAGTTSYYNNPMGGGGMGMGGGGMGGGGMGGGGMGMGGGGMGMGGPGMGGPGMGMGGPGMGMGGPGMGGNQFGAFGQQNRQPQQQDIFSLPADPLMDSAFSQPLLPANTGATGPQKSAPPSKPQEFDAFSGLSDLVNVAKDKVKNPEPTPPRYSVLYTDDQPIKETVDFPPPAPSRVESLQPPPPTTNPNISSAGNTGFGGFDDVFGGTLGGGGSGTSDQPAASTSQSPWVSF